MSNITGEGVPAIPAGSPDELRALALNLYLKTDQARGIAAETSRRKATRATRPLFWIAVANTIDVFQFAGFLHAPLAAGNVHAEFALILAIALPAAYWGLWAWSLISPLPAAIVGMLLFTSVSSLVDVSVPTDSPMKAYTGLSLVGLVTIVLLVIAIINGARERALRLSNSTADSGPPKSRNIASAIFLYLIYLSIIMTLRQMVTDRQLEMKDFFDILKLTAIVVLTWAALAWRDTLPALRFPAPQWLLFAVMFGLGTFIFASISGDVIGYIVGMKHIVMSAPFRNAGYGWLTCLAIIAVFPAIFEELAFRGIILPCLGRVLTQNEAIVVSGMMFMILHLSIESAPHLLLLGIVIGILRVRSGSLWPCVLMHFTHNAMCVAFEKWMM